MLTMTQKRKPAKPKRARDTGKARLLAVRKSTRPLTTRSSGRAAKDMRHRRGRARQRRFRTIYNAWGTGRLPSRPRTPNSRRGFPCRTGAGALPTVKIGKRTFTILFPDLLRPLTERELIDLRKSIRRRGVAVPIIVDEEDGVIDGGNRLRISAELKLTTIPTEVYPTLTLEGKRELALSLNLDRRHLEAATVKKLKEERVERVAAASRGEELPDHRGGGGGESRADSPGCT